MNEATLERQVPGRHAVAPRAPEMPPRPRAPSRAAVRAPRRRGQAKPRHFHRPPRGLQAFVVCVCLLAGRPQKQVARSGHPSLSDHRTSHEERAGTAHRLARVPVVAIPAYEGTVAGSISARGKVLWKGVRKIKNRAGQMFRMALAISKSRAPRTATTCWAKVSIAWPASPTVGPRSCAIRPRRNAMGRPLGHARSGSSKGSRPCARNYQTKPISRPNPNKMKLLVPLPKRTHLPPKPPLQRLALPRRPPHRTRNPPAPRVFWPPHGPRAPISQAKTGACRNTAEAP